MSKEKNRNLSKAEERRLANFGNVKANVYAIIAVKSISALAIFLFFLKNKDFQFDETNMLKVVSPSSYELSKQNYAYQ